MQRHAVTYPELALTTAPMGPPLPKAGWIALVTVLHGIKKKGSLLGGRGGKERSDAAVSFY